jgi:cardiolipin synthase
VSDYGIYLFIAPFLTFISIVLTVIIVWSLLRRHRTPTSTFAWILAIVLIPYVGIPLFLMFGGRKLQKATSRKGMLREFSHPKQGDERVPELLLPQTLSGVFPTTIGEKLEFIADGEYAFRKVISLIRSAETSINICTYILGNDETGKAIIDALTKKAKAGIAVRLLIDSYGSLRLASRVLGPLRDAGGEAAFFVRILPIPFHRSANLRNHRKMILIDGETAAIGGMNMSTEYMGADSDSIYWKDICLVLDGQKAAHLHEVFASDWAYATSKELESVEERDWSDENRTSAKTQIIASGPDVERDPLHEAILVALFKAKKRIWIVSPYILPGESLLNAMVIAAQRGIDLRLITPKRSNHPIADFAREGYLSELQRSGAHIMFYTKGMLHAKAILVDDDVSIIGSANLDMRSMFFNYEVAVGIQSNSFANQLDVWMSSLLEDSQEGVRTKNRLEQAFFGIGRLLAPIL